MKKYWFVIFLLLFGLYSGSQAQDRLLDPGIEDALVIGVKN